MTARYIGCNCSGADTITIRAVSVEVAIDSDNNDEFDPPARDAAERAAEARGDGKLVIFGSGDSDEDYIPDFADGTTKWFQAPYATSGVTLIPVIVDLSQFPLSENSEINVGYSACDPDELTRTEVAPGRYTYAIGSISGNARLWTTDASPRFIEPVKDGGDYIAPDTYTPAELGLSGGGTVT